VASDDATCDAKNESNQAEEARVAKELYRYSFCGEVVSDRELAMIQSMEVARAYTLDSSPMQRRVSGDNPIEVQMIAAVAAPLEGCEA
jgi:hypothetical protein